MVVMAGSKHAFAEVRDRLRADIRRRNMSVGDRMPTVSQLAKEYNVSRNTVIRAVTELVNEGVLESRRRVGITVRSISFRIGVKKKSLLAISKYGPVHVSKKMSDAIIESLPGWRMFHTEISGAESNDYCEEFLDEFINNNQYEVYLLNSVNSKLKRYFQKRQLPCVVVGDLSEGIDLPNVAFDEYERYYQATSYLLQKGYPNIAFIQFARKNPGDYRRETAVCAAYSEAQCHDEIKKPVLLDVDDSDRQKAELVLDNFIREALFPVGVVSGSDTATCWLLQKAHDIGIEIPGQLGIVTSGITDLPTHTYPQITSLKPDQTRLGFAVGGMLTRILAGYGPEPRHLIIPYHPPYIIERQTTEEPTAAVSL